MAICVPHPGLLWNLDVIEIKVLNTMHLSAEGAFIYTGGDRAILIRGFKNLQGDQKVTDSGFKWTQKCCLQHVQSRKNFNSAPQLTNPSSRK